MAGNNSELKDVPMKIASVELDISNLDQQIQEDDLELRQEGKTKSERLKLLKADKDQLAGLQNHLAELQKKENILLQQQQQQQGNLTSCFAMCCILSIVLPRHACRPTHCSLLVNINVNARAQSH